jgi:phosphatidylglycerophosphate synthase
VLAAAAYGARLTPNQVTAVSAVFTFSGLAVLALAPAEPLVGLLVAGLLVLGYALDSADGQLARLTGGGSLGGEWLDHTVDSVKVVAFHLAVLVTLYRSFDLDPLWLVVPLAFAVVSSVHFFGMILVDLFRRVRSAEAPDTIEAPPAPSRASSLLKIPTDYGVLCLAMLLLGFHGPFVGVYTVLAAAMVGYTALVLGKWQRDIVHLERGGRS